MSEEDEIDRVVRVAVKAVLVASDAARRQAHQRFYGYKSIANAVEEIVGERPNERTVKRWVSDRGLPLDRDPMGVFVTRWNLERWLDVNRSAVTGA